MPVLAYDQVVSKLYDNLLIVRARKGTILHAIWYQPVSEDQVHLALCKRKISGQVVVPDKDAKVTCQNCLRAILKATH